MNTLQELINKTGEEDKIEEAMGELILEAALEQVSEINQSSLEERLRYLRINFGMTEKNVVWAIGRKIATRQS